MKTRVFLIITISFLAIWTLSFPVRDLAADHYYRKINDILDDPATLDRDVLAISEKTLPAYRAAIASLHRAAAIVPSRARYQFALGDLYSRMWKWSAIMRNLNAPLPVMEFSFQDTAEQAMTHLQHASTLEPTNPDIHLALGKLYASAIKDMRRSTDELKKAEHAFPHNAPLRYVLAMHYRMSGNIPEALAQARALAGIDDTHILPESIGKADMLRHQPPEYIAMLKRSYLYHALNIARDLTGDPDVIRSMTPATPDAEAVCSLVLDAMHLSF